MSDASRSPEHVLGSIRVAADIMEGSQMLRIFFTETRLIMANVGKRGMGSMTGIFLFGRLGSGFEGLVRSPREAQRRKKLESGGSVLTPDEILSADKSNFEIKYDEVVRVSLERTPYSLEIMMLTRDEKYRFSTKEDSAKVLRLFKEPLSAKVEIRDRDLRMKK